MCCCMEIFEQNMHVQVLLAVFLASPPSVYLSNHFTPLQDCKLQLHGVMPALACLRLVAFTVGFGENTPSG